MPSPMRRGRMRRREFVAFVGAAVMWPLAARAQQPKRIARIGFLDPGALSGYVDELFAGLRDLGWVEGANLRVEYRSAGGDDGRLPALAAELVALNLDVIVTAASGVFAARGATATVPIVVTGAPDLVAMGLVASLAHPSGNLTGQTFFLPQLFAKR